MRPALHSFTGCDTTSAFVRRGKVAPLKVLGKRRNFLSTFHSLGQTVEVQETIINELEQFVYCMYGKPKYTSVNKLRYDLFIQKYQPTSGNLLTSGDGIDLSLLPPCRDSLSMHIRRANYQALVWNSAQDCFPDIPEPIGHGWAIDDTVFPRINARGVYFKIRDFRGPFIRGGRSFEGARLFQNFKNSGNRIWTYKNKKTFMPCDQCYLHCDMLTNYFHTYKNQLKQKNP